MSSAPGTMPVIVLREGTTEREEDEVRNHILVSSNVLSDAIRPLLGPCGRLKLIMDTFGDVTVTGSGAAVLEEVDIEHPVAKIIVEMGKTLNKEIGDGVTASVILSSELIRKGIAATAQGIHPTLVTRAYLRAAGIAQKAIEGIASRANTKDRKTLFNVARTAISGTRSRQERDLLAELAVEAATRVQEAGKLDMDRVKLDKKSGEVVTETIFIEGVALDKELVHPAMPKTVKDAKIALLDLSLEVKKTEFDEKLKFKDPSLLREFIEEEQNSMRAMVEKIKASGASVVLCQKGIDDFVQYALAKESMPAVRRVKKSDMDKLALATGGKLITNLDDLSRSALGRAEVVEERKLGDEKWTFIRAGKGARVVNVVFRGANDKIVGETERAFKKALNMLRVLMQEPKVVPGGGATEMEISRRVREAARDEGGKVSVIMEDFADAMEIIPKTLAKNAGWKAEEAGAKLKAAHSKGKVSMGTGDMSSELTDAKMAGLLEPLAMKRAAMLSAVETAVSLLRIDRITAASKFKAAPKGKEG